MRQISETSRLFTGSENGDMEKLSVAQVSALLNHNWEPGNTQVNPRAWVSMISNIKNHAELQHRSYGKDSEAADGQIQEQEQVCHDEAGGRIEAAGHDVKTIEELHQGPPGGNLALGCNKLASEMAHCHSGQMIRKPPPPWPLKPPCSELGNET
jgi:hypothetical protein